LPQLTPAPVVIEGGVDGTKCASDEMRGVRRTWGTPHV